MLGQQDVLVTASTRLSDVLSKQEVDDYLTALPDATPFDSWAWLATADATLPDNEKCFIVGRTKNGDLLGWLPLRLGYETLLGLKIPVLRFLTEPRSDRHSVQVPADNSGLLNELVGAVKHKHGKWSAVLLDEVGDVNLPESQPRGWYSTVKRQTPIFLFGETEPVSRSSRGLISKRGRRARKKLEKLDHAFKVWQPNESEVANLMETFRAVENRSWKGEQGVGIFSSDAGFEFFRGVATRAAEAGSLMVGTVHVEGVLASYRFGFLWGGVFYDYNFAYLPDYSHLSLGRVLLDEIILSGFEAGLRGIDGSRVGASYENLLRERSDASVEHRRWMHFRWTPGGILLRLKFLGLKPLKRMLRSTLNSDR